MKRIGWVWLGLLLMLPVRPVAAQGPVDFTELRNHLVDQDLVNAGVRDARVLEAFRSTPRHEFVAAAQRANAYYDMSLPIGEGQTISPPSGVAQMTELLDVQPTDVVLEIGTGSGFQAAVLSKLAKEVYTIEIVKPLGERAAATFKRLKLNNLHAKIGDGYQGWSEHAPFDRIMVTCSPEAVPEKLVEQLKEGGKLLVPVGQRYQQNLYLFTKKNGKLESREIMPTMFVPMTGQAEVERKIKPDPLHPAIANGGFEELAADPKLPAAWFFGRQIEVVTATDAPQGERYLKLANSVPGRPAMVIQAFPIDGTKIRRLAVSCRVKGENIQAGKRDVEAGAVVVLFYDKNRAEIATTWLGPWRGTFDWRNETEQIRVPEKAREAILQVGLYHATGTLWCDDFQVAPVGSEE